MLRWTAILDFLRDNVKGVRKSQLKTLAVTAHSAMQLKGVGVLALGRAMVSRTTAKHCIKRVWRFFRNTNFDSREVAKGLFSALVPLQGRIIVLVDWTDIEPWQKLVFSLPRDGRATPFFSLTIRKRCRKDRNEHAMAKAETEALLWFSKICPQNRSVVFVADRGFGNYRHISDLLSHKWDYVQRIAGNHYVELSDYKGPISELPIIEGAPIKQWKDCRWTSTHAVKTRVIGVHERGAKEPWVLITSLEDYPAEIVRIYKRRMWIEATFRDMKNRYFGFGMDKTRLSSASRHDNLFITLAVAFIFLSAFGAFAEKQNYDRTLKANTRTERVLNLVKMGYFYLDKTDAPFSQIFKALLMLPV
jgi:hypothetical protein